MASYNRYQYETSPRKLEPNYRPTPKKYPKKDVASRKTSKKSVAKKQPIIKKDVKSIKKLVVMYIVIAFCVLFAISYRNSMIAEEFNNIKSMKSELASLEKENEQLKANIESSLNLNNIEKTASENLGMTKLDNSRTVYINMQKQDYVQSATEEVNKKDNTNLLTMIANWFNNIIK